jgi:hypothetical protein
MATTIQSQFDIGQTLTLKNGPKITVYRFIVKEDGLWINVKGDLQLFRENQFVEYQEPKKEEVEEEEPKKDEEPKKAKYGRKPEELPTEQSGD